jgi:hypothetical protein
MSPTNSAELSPGSNTDGLVGEHNSRTDQPLVLRSDVPPADGLDLDNRTLAMVFTTEDGVRKYNRLGWARTGQHVVRQWSGILAPAAATLVVVKVAGVPPAEAGLVGVAGIVAGQTGHRAVQWYRGRRLERQRSRESRAPDAGPIR